MEHCYVKIRSRVNIDLGWLKNNVNKVVLASIVALVLLGSIMLVPTLSAYADKGSDKAKADKEAKDKADKEAKDKDHKKGKKDDDKDKKDHDKDCKKDKYDKDCNGDNHSNNHNGHGQG